LRTIQLKRAGKVISTLDLYDLLLAGDTSADQPLQPGDVIFVPVVQKQITLSGSVRRPQSMRFWEVKPWRVSYSLQEGHPIDPYSI